MKTEILRHKEALQRAMFTLKAITQVGVPFDDRNIFAKSALADIDAILNPPVEMEDLPIERWVCLKCGKSYEYEASLCSCYPTGSSTDSYVPVKLTGTLTRPKPVPVERSVELEVKWIKPQYHRALPIAQKGDADFEWEQLVGKTGRFTFTWTE